MRTLLNLQIARDLARDSGLSEADYDVLSTLTERVDARWRVGELAARLLWSTGRLTHHLNRMEARGLVARHPCRDDARGASLTLTDTGWSSLQAAAPLHVLSVRKYFVDLLTAEEIHCLATISEKVIQRLSGLAEDSARATPSQDSPV